MQEEKVNQSEYKKDFDNWNGVKQKTDIKNHIPPRVKVGDVWWVSVGINIGHEIDGKSKVYSRPCIVLRKISRKMFLILPLTTSLNKGKYYLNMNLNNLEGVACFNQIKTADYRRFVNLYTTLSSEELSRVSDRFNSLYSTNYLTHLAVGESEVDTAPRIDFNISNTENKSSVKRGAGKNIVILVGRSGSGKGTQGEFIKKYLEEKLTDENSQGKNCYYISTGQRFRDFVSGESRTASIAREINEKGGLQPEFLAVWNWSSILIDTVQTQGNIIFDGAPRKLHEAQVLDSAVSFYGWAAPIVIEIDVSLDECVKRMLDRKRADDTETVIRERLGWYDRDVIPMLEWYKANDNYIYKHIGGERSVEEIRVEIERCLDIIFGILA
jgi:adenylate kinase family enzyme/mRNA-degrading endonuclease toxin of MazEF toxin-antitoxin module